MADMDQRHVRDSRSDAPSRAAAELALFALWRGCAASGIGGLTPKLALDGLVTSVRGVSLQEAGANLMRVADECWLVAAAEDLAEPSAVLHVTVRRVPADTRPASRGRGTPGVFRFPSHVGPPANASRATTLVFGGYTRLRVTSSDLHEAEARYGLFGYSPAAAAGPADSPWAADLLPPAERTGCEWVILLGHSVAYDPPWNRDAV